MLLPKIDDSLFHYKNISRDDFKELLNFYNSEEDFRFATGIELPLTIRNLYEKYAQTVVSKNEFFIGVYLVENDELIGAIRGGVNGKTQNGLWINSIAIDKNYQNKGYGTKIINSIIDYFDNNYEIDKVYVSVVGINSRAKDFWRKLGFVDLRKMKSSIYLDNKKQEIIIMQKELNKTFAIS